MVLKKRGNWTQRETKMRWKKTIAVRAAWRWGGGKNHALKSRTRVAFTAVSLMLWPEMSFYSSGSWCLVNKMKQSEQSNSQMLLNFKTQWLFQVWGSRTLLWAAHRNMEHERWTQEIFWRRNSVYKGVMLEKWWNRNQCSMSEEEEEDVEGQKRTRLSKALGATLKSLDLIPETIGSHWSS